MEQPAQTPIDKNALRVRIILGKFQVSQLVKGNSGLLMTVQLPNSVFMRCDLPVVADVQVGDYLTFYTEVLADLTKQLPDPDKTTGG